MAGMHLLVVDDEPAVRESLERSLLFEGYTVETAENGQRALDRVLDPDGRKLDALVLDLMMPGVDGLETCRRLRAAGADVPILMLTARDAVSDRVSGLNAGADDYLPKPFALEELLARLRALLRRGRVVAESDGVLKYEDLVVDVGTREAHRGGQEIELTRTEFDLLALFLSAPKQVFTRKQLLREVWGYDYDPGTNILDVYVGYLRRKTEAGGGSRLLHTVRGVGYVLRSRG
ncbi:two-component system, OmpR family, response regulator MprA [Allokutzneria albata]|uniref:Two-component system, OmpR family, response regulator MprA n=2 Tax=Allokutzneria albata TaxID=211114 RepID=A0A1G9WMA6_ALLAB|nr:two-component system, OmpR family, response regulator MprA [Allokutzneria albata]